MSASTRLAEALDRLTGREPLISEETEPVEARAPKSAVSPQDMRASDPGADIAFAAKAPKPRI